MCKSLSREDGMHDDCRALRGAGGKYFCGEIVRPIM